MSVAEMKLKVINKITAESNETILQEILAILDRTKTEEQQLVRLSNHYDAIKNQYGEVLQKLAQ